MKSFYQTLLTFILTTTAVDIFSQEVAAVTMTTDATTLPTGEPVAEEGEASSLNISGFVDAYYQYHFEEMPFPTSFTETHNSFTPGMANVVFSKEGKFGFVADLAVGPRAEVANGYNGTTLALIKQLYISYAASDRVSFTLGNFGTFVGYEVIDAPANINYSTSYMFSNGPFYHTGLKADFVLSEHFGAMVGVFDDTDSKIDEVSGKHFGVQLSYEIGGLSAYLNFLTGKEDDTNPDDEYTGTQFDLTATYTVTEAFGLGLNATTKMIHAEESGDANWFGAALYANYTFSELFTLGLRGEYIGDDDGLILGVPDNSITSFTLSGNFHLGPITLIPEFRIDQSSKDAYFDKDGNPTSNSPALIFAAVYSF